MTTFASLGGKTDQEGGFKPFQHLFRPGVASGFTVMQRGAGANMSVDVAAGADLFVTSSSVPYYGWADATTNVTVSPADPSLERLDTLVAYLDLSLITSATTNNQGALKFMVVSGTPAASSPSAPSDSTVQAAISSGNPFQRLRNIAVAHGVSTIVNANLTDVSTPAALAVPYLYGGGSNTKGHLVPNVADDTVALLNVTQTLANKNLTSSTINGTSVDNLITGWNSLGSSLSVVSNDGNRSFTLQATGVDLRPTLSAGMRLRIARTTSPLTQCGTFVRSSTQYASVSSVAGMTFTSAFTIMADIKLDSYPSSGNLSIIRCDDAGATNGWGLTVNSSGQLRGFYKASSTNTIRLSYQSIPLRRKVHVAMVVSSVSGKTFAMYLNGVLVDSYFETSATTTLGQGTILAIGATGTGTDPFDGKMQGVSVFSSGLSQSTIRSYMHKVLAGNESGLVGYWKLSGNFNDSTTNANNLTATGGATATGTDVFMGANEYVVVSSDPSYSGSNTTLVVQAPTDGGLPIETLGTVSYSSQHAPYGFPASKRNWTILAYQQSAQPVTPSANTWYNVGLFQLYTPPGPWRLGYDVCASNEGGATSTIRVVYATLAKSAAAEDDVEYTTVAGSNDIKSSIAQLARSLAQTNSTGTTYYLNLRCGTNNGTSLNISPYSASFLIGEYAYV